MFNRNYSRQSKIKRLSKFLTVLSSVWYRNATSLLKLKETRQSRGYAENHGTGQCFEASGPQGHFFEKNKKKRFRMWSRGVCVPNFRSVSFSVWPGEASRLIPNVLLLLLLLNLPIRVLLGLSTRLPTHAPLVEVRFW